MLEKKYKNADLKNNFTKDRTKISRQIEGCNSMIVIQEGQNLGNLTVNLTVNNFN